mmetsp:Transcript_43547/g.112812  ORF Transcript_43547/g.112812 Transcript_43547/m.112812 type:complete len:239 (-) Transcript_43547:757-1473(-)
MSSRVMSRSSGTPSERRLSPEAPSGSQPPGAESLGMSVRYTSSCPSITTSPPKHIRRMASASLSASICSCATVAVGRLMTAPSVKSLVVLRITSSDLYRNWRSRMKPGQSPARRRVPSAMLTRLGSCPPATAVRLLSSRAVSFCRIHSRSMLSSNIQSCVSACAATSSLRPMLRISRAQVPMPSPPSSSTPSALSRGSDSGSDDCVRSSSRSSAESAAAMYQLSRLSSLCSCPAAQPQ